MPARKPGLSPRVRGNLPRSWTGGITSRSIPACTGEPVSERLAVRGIQVYPRVYGGTLLPCCSPWCQTGLSPRVRGNLVVRSGDLGAEGSIPACTGEPKLSASLWRYAQVYPRVYGGTTAISRFSAIWAGLSPRVRGNLWESVTEKHGDGSIPACTGEPNPENAERTEAEVYPRVYGGTAFPSGSGRSRQGLSPRVRGNHGRFLVI